MQQQVHISPAVFEPQHTQKHSRARTYIYLLLLLPLELPLRPRTTNRPTDDLCATQCSGATKYTTAASVIAKKKQNRKASSSALSHGGRLLHGLQGRHDWPFLFPKEPPSVCSIYIVVVSRGMKNLEEEEEEAAAAFLLQIKEGKNVRQLFSSSITT